MTSQGSNRLILTGDNSTKETMNEVTMIVGVTVATGTVDDVAITVATGTVDKTEMIVTPEKDEKDTDVIIDCDGPTNNANKLAMTIDKD